MGLFEYSFLRKEYNNKEAYDSLFENKMFCDAKDIQINDNDEFDIFLSHSYSDREIIPKLKNTLEKMGYTVYVDWINDRLLSREDVSNETAEILQKRMKQSKSLFFATSENSPSSKWMPWELGYFDGIKDKRVAILPIKKENNGFNENFKGQEYLGLYYYVSLNTADKSLFGKIYAMEKNAFNSFVKRLEQQITVYIHKDLTNYIHFNEWVEGEEPISQNPNLVMNFSDIKE